MAMTLEEAILIALDKNISHATVTYDLAERVLDDSGFHRVAQYAANRAKLQRKLRDKELKRLM